MLDVLNDLFAQRIVSVLNEALELDRDAVQELVAPRDFVRCNEALADHPTIQAAGPGGWEDSRNRGFGVRTLGLLNGLCGILPNGSGRIAAEMQVYCPLHGDRPAPTGELCGFEGCAEPKREGKLLRFVLVGGDFKPSEGAPPKRERAPSVDEWQRALERSDCAREGHAMWSRLRGEVRLCDVGRRVDASWSTPGDSGSSTGESLCTECLAKRLARAFAKGWPVGTWETV